MPEVLMNNGAQPEARPLFQRARDRYPNDFWLNLVFGALGLYLWRLDAKHPMDHHHGSHAGHEAA